MLKTIIGLTGSFGSGCTHIAKNYLEPEGFKLISLSTILKRIFQKEIGNKTVVRQDLQNYGNTLRQKNGAEFLARQAIDEIEKDQHSNRWIVDSIKNPAEIVCLRKQYSNFFLFGIYADYDLRWQRVKDKYGENEGSFRKDDERDHGEEIIYGQQVRKCFVVSDIIVSNNVNYQDGNDDQLNMKTKVDSYLRLMENPVYRLPTEEEALMAVAYANSLRSSCLKRKVGAVIVDKNGFLFSSGYNEVPIGEKPCMNQHGGCYRDMVKSQFQEILGQHVDNPETRNALASNVAKETKMLDYCRALHAEENAILNVARFGSSLALSQATLYTTTYPCNLCANKIAQVGIRKIVYFEPYPMDEAKKLLTSRGIEQKPFEGVSFNGFFRLFRGE